MAQPEAETATPHVTLPRRGRDLPLTIVPLVLLAGLMRWPGHFPAGAWIGLALVLAAAVGILGLLGDSPLDLRGDESEGEVVDARPWWRREGSIVVLVSSALYLPMAGAFGLWDPWETHYSEVAREILSRDDWITTWWAQEGWFMSKPVLIFWMSALGMSFGVPFGVRYAADAGPNVQEWFIRLPICALAIAALWALSRAVSRAWGPRAGMCVALVLATMPQWFFLAHQAMTDMPFVASLTLALSMFMLAVVSDPSALARPRLLRLGPVTLRYSLWHLTVGAVLLLVLPQVVYLLTRSLSLGCAADANVEQCTRMMRANRLGPIQVPFETFYSGSAGNSGVDGAPSVQGSPVWERVASAVPFLPSVLQGLVWSALLVWALRDLRHERTQRGLYFALFYVWCAVATMGKGPAGLAIPGAVALLHYVASTRWRELKEIRLGVGVLLFLLVGMPWYVAITARLGNEFIQRFIVHDIINRTMVGVHGDTGSVRYFLWQLGYAMFPWSGLVPVAMMAGRLVVPADATQAQRDLARIGLLWFSVAFVLFSAMITKFHHYIFPALPGAAVMVGLLVDRMLPKPSDDAPPRWDLWISRALGVLLLVLGAARCVGTWSGRLDGRGAPFPGNPVLGVTLIAFGVAALALSWWREDRPETDRWDSMLGGLGVAAACVTGLVGRDLATRRSAPPGSERLIHLFVYNYDRQWPLRFLDFSPMLLGFAVVAVALLALLGVARIRGAMMGALLCLAVLFAGWSLDVYMIALTPHWSQRGLFERYYARRRARPSPNPDPRFAFDPIVAHQMNWKGENFYTGNHVVAEECGLKYCTGSTSEWVREHPNQRAFFITEHSRVQGLLSQIRQGGGHAETISTEAEDNKFVLVEATLGAGAPRP
jgi:4-amino-4-deoxy-L-arabinose transferase-like glycosyltransferase